MKDNVPINKNQPQNNWPSQNKNLDDHFDIPSLLPTAGKLSIDKETKEALFEPIDEKKVEIRPDGLIYLPWTEYAERLKKAFGIGWTLIPDGHPKISQNHIYWGFYLVIKGHLMGYAIGEQEYHPGNQRMTYGDACEGAKSNALMRLCKGIGIGLELWSPSYNREWKAKYAKQIQITDRYGMQKKIWVKKTTSEDSYTETKYASEISPQPLPDDHPKISQNHKQNYSKNVYQSLPQKINALLESITDNQEIQKALFTAMSRRVDSNGEVKETENFGITQEWMFLIYDRLHKLLKMRKERNIWQSFEEKFGHHLLSASPEEIVKFLD